MTPDALRGGSVTDCPHRAMLAVMTISHATDLWLGELTRQGHSDRTVDKYRRLLDKLADTHSRHTDVADLTIVHVRGFLDRQAKRANGTRKAPATIAQDISTVCGFFDWLTSEGIIGRTSTLSTPERQERVSPVVNKLGRAAGTKPKDLMLVPFEVAFALRADGWWLRQVIVWDKPNPIPESAKDRPTTSHEYVLLLSKSRHYWYDADAIAEPATWERWGAQTMRKPVVGKAHMVKNRLTKGEIRESVARATRNARSVWRIVCAQFDGDHAAVMPTELAARCILAGCPKGGVVLDPFGGAGTTAVAARALGRRSVLIELSEDSCAIAADRLSQQSLLTEGAA